MNLSPARIAAMSLAAAIASFGMGLATAADDTALLEEVGGLGPAHGDGPGGDAAHHHALEDRLAAHWGVTLGLEG